MTLPNDPEGKSVLIIKGSPYLTYDPQLIGDAMEEAKRLAAENDEPYTVVVCSNLGMVYEPVLSATTTEEYVQNEGPTL